MIKTIRNLYLTDRFFMWGAAVVICFAMSYFLGFLFPVAQALLVLFVSIVVLESLILFLPKQLISCERELNNVFSLGDENKVELRFRNLFHRILTVRVIEVLPEQFQMRDNELQFSIETDELKPFVYRLRPVERGVYVFGNVISYSKSVIGLISRKESHLSEVEVEVYPSILQMRKYELQAFSKISFESGVKRIRRIGHSYEFEQIKNYVRGDDFRSINWKASSRKASLMVNQYEDEKSQQVYCVIDKGRNMKMPFNGMSLLDYAINTSLMLSNVALKKHDMAGLLSFSDSLGSFIKADRSSVQLQKILKSLFREVERPSESNYELLYQSIRKLITRRSMLVLFSNFESIYAMERVLPVLRKLNKQHLLVLVFFDNSELKEYVASDADDLKGIYKHAIARDFIDEKERIVQELSKHRIHSIKTKPEELSLNVLNKYLELKSRGLI